MANVYGRDYVSLNGKWNVLPDIYDRGEKKRFEQNRKPEGKTDFVEYSFDGARTLDVPGDWNSQSEEFKYYEGAIWYGRHFGCSGRQGGRKYLYFCGVSTRCKVWLNGEFLGAHEGAFTPFQFEVTDILREGDNFIAVKVSNVRTEDSIPALYFDWWNYGGITRDVMLVSVPEVYIEDYHVKLDGSHVRVEVALSSEVMQRVNLEIAQLGIRQTAMTGEDGRVVFTAKPHGLERWSPQAPRLYPMRLSSGADSICEDVGFRTVGVEGTRILVNGVPTFMRSVSFHEEIPQRMGRACTQEDAEYLLGAAKALGINMVRLAHYPQNEHIVRLADKMGIILWEEIPLWQGIDFDNPLTRAKAVAMYKEMLLRDRNRCSVCFWGLANETRPSPERDGFLTEVLAAAKSTDDTRLFAIADDLARYNSDTGCFEMNDPFARAVDVVAVNIYLGWYAKWPSAPAECKWNVYPDKPLIISEFGGEALFGVRGDADVASSWSEDYQAALYRDNIAMFDGISNLAGVSPWALFDFRSPTRLHPMQGGWNRKGLLSDRGERKRAWFVMHDYFEKISRMYEN